LQGVYFFKHKKARQMIDGPFSWGAVKKIMKKLLLDGYIITPLPKMDLK